MVTNRNTFGIFWAAAIAVISVSCGKDITDDSEVNKTNGRPERGLYSFSIAAGNGNTTRAVLDQGDYKYYWETGDQVGLIIVPAGSATPIDPANPVVKMTNDHAGLTDHTTFSGELTQTQINAMSSGNTYDYYSYFPYGAGVVGALPEIQFTIPSTLSLQPDVFNPDYAPMVAQVETNQPPIVYQYGAEVQHGSLIHFDYKHTMSYAAIEMDVNLLPQAITSMTITNNSGTLISGSYSYNMDNGSAGYISGSNSITIDITGGLYVGDGSVLYVPMPPVDMTGENFTLTFNNGSSVNKYENVTTVSGIKFEKGKIHRLRVAPAATYTETTSFTVTKSGYYYIEAWGGNGGSSSSGIYGTAAGGSGGVTRGLFYISAGTSFDVLIGMHGEDAGGRRANAAGGTSGIGTGGNGARGGDHSLLGGNYGYAGGGGGGASGVRIGGTVRLAAGGGGGGGGTGEHSRAGNSGWQPVHKGSDGSDSDSSSPPGNGNGASTGTSNGAGGQDGESGNAGAYNGGGGGGGGGGGYPRGGFGGPGGSRLGNLSSGDPRGGGAGGGMNYVLNAETNTSGYTLPTNNRPGDRTDGYIVITFIR